MLGAIAGDVIGSVFERVNLTKSFYDGTSLKPLNFPLFREDSRFTDDTVLTVAVADAFMNRKDYANTIREYGRKHPTAGYGGTFIRWLDNPQMGPYNSWGNGSAMRVSSIGWFLDSLEDVLKEAERTAEVTHNHPEGIKGAQAIAAAVFLARKGSSKDDIKTFIQETFGYDLNRTLLEIGPTYEFDVSCQGSVPEAIISFLESNDFEDCIRKAISIGGDSDTIACMAGAIAEPFYGGIPDHIMEGVFEILQEEEQFLDVLLEFKSAINSSNNDSGSQ